MKRKLINLLGFILMGIGILTFLSPDFSAYKQQKDADKEIDAFEEEAKVPKDKDPLYQESLKYNQKIYQSGQGDLKDVWSYKAVPIRLKDQKESFGYIKIKKMDVKLPLYLGATLQNMRKGAAIMGETSLPLGTKNSNCVIAAHRGYRGIPYFRDIEQLKTGDQVIIRNPWERLDYRVTKIKVIDPYDMDKILIQKGKDMVTLITCHPYRGHGRYRYVVYCIRDHGQKIVEKKNSTIKDTHFKSSEWDIQREKIVHFVGCLFFGAVIIWMFAHVKKNKKGVGE